MIGWLYRLIYRREIRERQERAAAAVEVWRQRQVENDAKWERATARLHAFRDELRHATTPGEVQAALARVDQVTGVDQIRQDVQMVLSEEYERHARLADEEGS